MLDRCSARPSPKEALLLLRERVASNLAMTHDLLGFLLGDLRGFMLGVHHVTCPPIPTVDDLQLEQVPNSDPYP